MSTIRYYNNKREIPPVIAPGFVSFGEPEVFDEYSVTTGASVEPKFSWRSFAVDALCLLIPAALFAASAACWFFALTAIIKAVTP